MQKWKKRSLITRSDEKHALAKSKTVRAHESDDEEGGKENRRRGILTMREDDAYERQKKVYPMKETQIFQGNCSSDRDNQFGASMTRKNLGIIGFVVWKFPSITRENVWLSELVEA